VALVKTQNRVIREEMGSVGGFTQWNKTLCVNVNEAECKRLN